MTVRTPLYVAIAFAFIAFGMLGLFSIGVPFILTGVAMLAVLPWRRWTDVVWPALAAPWVFTVAYLLLAPLSCGSTSSSPRTECSNVLGIDDSGTGDYRAPLAPAVVVGLVAAVLVALVLHRFLARRRGHA